MTVAIDYESESEIVETDADSQLHLRGDRPHEKYVRVVSEADSPVQPTWIKTKDGLYVAAAVRKPRGNGPFPAIVMFHGAPGGRGMDQLVGWSQGSTGRRPWPASPHREPI